MYSYFDKDHSFQNVPELDPSSQNVCCTKLQDVRIFVFLTKSQHYGGSQAITMVHLSSFVIHVLHVPVKQDSKCSNDPYLPYLRNFFSALKKSSQMYGPTHAILQQTDCTISSVLVSLLAVVKVKIIYTGIKLKSLFMSSMTPNLKEIVV